METNEEKFLTKLFLIDAKNKTELSPLDNDLIEHYQLGDDLIEEDYEYTEADHNRIKRRAALKRLLAKLNDNILFNSIEHALTTSLSISQEPQEVLGYSDIQLEKEQIVLSNVETNSTDKAKIILDIEYENDYAYITMTNTDNLEIDIEYTLMCLLENLEVVKEVITFTKNDYPTKLKMPSYITNILKNNTKILFIINHTFL